MSGLPLILAESVSTGGRRVDLVFAMLMVFSLIVTFIVLAIVLYCITRYRASVRGDRSQPDHEKHALEYWFMGLFFVIGMSLFIWGTAVYADLVRPPVDSMAIFVVGKQWMWKLHQPSGREEINTLHVPIDRDVKLVMTSQDVIHSFYIPAFRVKQDVLPDRYTTLWFRATKAGKYRIHCAQYCGTDHSVMTGWVYAMDPREYEKWLAAEPSGEPAIAGTPGTTGAAMATGLRNTFNAAGCIACHTPTSSIRAPRLDGIYERKVRLQNGQIVDGDDQYIRESILYPNAKISAGYPQPSLMPSYKGQLSDQQIDELIAFIRSIRDGWPDDATNPKAGALPQNPPVTGVSK